MFEKKKLIEGWQNRQYGKGVHFQEESFFDELREACSQASSVLDIGVGDGRMPRDLMPFCKVFFVGIDITDRCRESPTVSVIGDTRCLPFKENIFDVVYSLGVVEHFPETALALSEHVRVLKLGGTMFFTTPHLSIATIYKYYQFYRSGQYKTNTFEAMRGRNLTLRYVRKALEGLSIEILRLETSGVRPAHSILSRIVKAIIPGAFQHPHLFCITRKLQ